GLIDSMRTSAALILVMLPFGVVLPSYAEMPERTYSVQMQPGVDPVMTPEAVAQVVLSSLAAPVQGLNRGPDGSPRPSPAPPQILEMRCVPGASVGVSFVKLGEPESEYEPRNVWIVRAKAPMNLPAGPGQSAVGNEGTILVDDANGRLMGRAVGFSFGSESAGER
ncbi:MAG: hypothetical protein MUF70_03085, partial [Myxococcota bacterium]|nr:hypothetical protein [Myxococcota bacterium]